MGDTGGASSSSDTPRTSDVSCTLEICNKRGLHARASAKFVMTVEQFDAEVWVTRGTERVSGASIMGLMMLAAGPGTTIKVEASGPQAKEAIAALTELVTGRFTEQD